MKFISIISLLLLLASNSIAQEIIHRLLHENLWTMQIHGQIYFPVKRMRGIFQQELYLHHERYARRRRD